MENPTDSRLIGKDSAFLCFTMTYSFCTSAEDRTSILDRHDRYGQGAAPGLGGSSSVCAVEEMESHSGTSGHTRTTASA